MSYTADDHVTFTRREQAWFLQLQKLRELAAKLIAIYTEETASGANPNFVTTGIASKQEYIDGIVFMGHFKNLIENGVVDQADRVPNITPFLQQE
jgi:hypothetical protein